jgi:hypothetical protein
MLSRMSAANYWLASDFITANEEISRSVAIGCIDWLCNKITMVATNFHLAIQ